MEIASTVNVNVNEDFLGCCQPVLELVSLFHLYHFKYVLIHYKHIHVYYLGVVSHFWKLRTLLC